MRCRRFRGLVVLTEEPGMGGARQGALRDHEEGCARCRQFAEETRAIRNLLRQRQAHRAPAGFAEEVMARVRAAQREEQRVRLRACLRQPGGRGTLEYVLALGAVVAILVSGGVFAFGSNWLGLSGVMGTGTAAGGAPASAVAVGDHGEGVRRADLGGTLEQLVLAHRSHVRQHSFTHGADSRPLAYDPSGVGGVGVDE